MLPQALEAARESAGKWEAQCQEALGQLEALKDLLEESALWQSAPGPHSSQQPPAADAIGGSSNGGDAPHAPHAADSEGTAAEAVDNPRGAHGNGAAAAQQLEQRYMQARMLQMLLPIARCC